MLRITLSGGKKLAAREITWIILGMSIALQVLTQLATRIG
jgi:hypothetical protein